MAASRIGVRLCEHEPRPIMARARLLMTMGATESARGEIVARLDSAEPAAVAGGGVTGKDQVDGWRFSTEQGWLLFRMSGTEPLLRIMVEAPSQELASGYADRLAAVTEAATTRG